MDETKYKQQNNNNLCCIFDNNLKVYSFILQKINNENESLLIKFY
ncbi:hypothetical protein LCGC14_2419360 [marine sediment metagenome]|uniref:Uncharacterized protein n=1 Tax=marine sediment metagenome TaxID=412755 RepID=A0A0F9EJG8_9ZZZZ